MRITFVTRQCYPAVGGVERVVENLGGALSALGHEITVVVQAVDELPFGRMTHLIRERRPFAPFTHRGMSIVQFRPTRARRTLLLPLAAEMIPLGGRLTRRWLGWHTSAYYARVVRPVLAPLIADAHMVHVLGGNFMAVAAIETARSQGTPTAISPFAHLGEWGDDAGSLRAYKHADVLIATTEADAEVYRGLGVPDRQIEVAGLPVPDAMIDPSPPSGETTAADEPPGPGDPLVLFLGQRRPTKRHRILLEAAERVWASSPATRFAFVGPGEPLGASDPRILDVGRVSDAQRGRWLARASVLALPSSSESFGLVVAEAWSQRVPVVVSDIPVLRELVESSGGGLVSSPDGPSFAEAIASLLLDPAMASSRGRAGCDYWRANLAPAAVAARHLEISTRGSVPAELSPRPRAPPHRQRRSPPPRLPSSSAHRASPPTPMAP